jgi:hypothetical protein
MIFLQKRKKGNKVSDEMTDVLSAIIIAMLEII